MMHQGNRRSPEGRDKLHKRGTHHRSWWTPPAAAYLNCGGLFGLRRGAVGGGRQIKKKPPHPKNRRMGPSARRSPNSARPHGV